LQSPNEFSACFFERVFGRFSFFAHFQHGRLGKKRLFGGIGLATGPKSLALIQFFDPSGCSIGRLVK
jgi:hypothetical protein